VVWTCREKHVDAKLKRVYHIEGSQIKPLEVWKDLKKNYYKKLSRRIKRLMS